jgi:hypothetical protein
LNGKVIWFCRPLNALYACPGFQHKNGLISIRTLAGCFEAAATEYIEIDERNRYIKFELMFEKIHDFLKISITNPKIEAKLAAQPLNPVRKVLSLGGAFLHKRQAASSRPTNHPSQLQCLQVS